MGKVKGVDYRRAEQDLHKNGCNYSGDIYFMNSEKSIRNMMRENGLREEKYYSMPATKDKKTDSESSDEGCFLTTACTVARNLPDDCDQLQTLRHYRDTYLKHREHGAEEVAMYYAIAPLIVSAINARSDSDAIWNRVFVEMVTPCVDMIGRGENEAAFRLYRDYTFALRETYCTG